MLRKTKQLLVCLLGLPIAPIWFIIITILILYEIIIDHGLYINYGLPLEYPLYMPLKIKNVPRILLYIFIFALIYSVEWPYSIRNDIDKLPYEPI